jgi:TetR/AcrR family transcriptional regulator, transcriptional repressor of bet genes
MIRSNYRLPFWSKRPKKPRGKQAPMDPKPRQKSADRKRDLAAAALRCLQRDGYAAVTARKIAAEAGMSLGHISYHFPSVDALLAQAYALASDQLREAGTQRLAAKANPKDRLEAFLLAGFTPEFLTHSHLRMRIDLWSAALSHPAIADTERALYARYRAELDALLGALARPEQAGDIARVSDMIMATLDGIWLDWIRRRDQSSTQNALLACLDYACLKLT